MSQFAGLPKSATSAPKVPPSPSVAAAGARVSPRGHTNMQGFADAKANDVTAPSIRIADTDIEVVRGKGGATHTYSQEEKMAFSMHINQCLAADPVAARHLPLDINGMDLFERVHDGLLLCKLINLAQHDTIDDRAMNVKDGMNVYQKTENLNLALNAAKAIGCQIVNIGSQDLLEGKPILVLGLVWQIIKIQLTSHISLAQFPELVVLLEEGETLAAFVKLPPEAILLRWMNYHLRKANYPSKINNFGSDISDSAAYGALMTQIKPHSCRPITGTDMLDRAAQAIANARIYGCEAFLQPKDIVDGNKKLNLGFVAQLFNTCHGLTLSEEERAAFDLSSLEMDDAGDTREERVLRMWINSLNIDGVYVNNLFGDLDDGVVILRVIDEIRPGTVEWKRVNLNPPSRFKKVENGNYCVASAAALHLSLVNVGGLDIIDRNKKIILAIVSQLMRKYTLQLLSVLGNGTEISDEQIVAWANEKVAASGRPTRMRNFKDKSLSNSMFYLELLNAIEPRSIEWSVVTPGVTEEDKTLNAKYAISTARKLGAAVFLTFEDVIEVKSKMLVTFLAAIWMAELQRRAH